MGADQAREELGRLVERRRIEVGLTKEAAARAVPMSSISWKRVEDGQPVRELTYSGIEKVLDWETGACMGFLQTGQEPRGREREKRSRTDELYDRLLHIEQLLRDTRKELEEEGEEEDRRKGA